MRKIPRALRALSPLYTRTFHPPRGEKQIFLPNFELTLLRTPHSPPHFASFLTPLNLNKLDLKDYLYHVYGLQVLSVRSYVIQAKVRMDKPGAKVPAMNRWFRPRATKKMTVELVQNAPGQGPFIWPDPPTDFTPWDKSIFEKQTAEQEEAQDEQGPDASLAPKKDAKALREQARALLEGRKRWRPGWDDYGVF